MRTSRPRWKNTLGDHATFPNDTHDLTFGRAHRSAGQEKVVKENGQDLRTTRRYGVELTP